MFIFDYLLKFKKKKWKFRYFIITKYVSKYYMKSNYLSKVNQNYPIILFFFSILVSNIRKYELKIIK